MKNTISHYRREKSNSASSGLIFYAASCRCDALVFYFIADSQKKIIHLTFSKAKHEHAVKRLNATYPDKKFAGDEQLRGSICQPFTEYVAGRLTRFPFEAGSLLLDQGTEFQKSVWQLISRIAYGTTKTYGDLANELGNTKLARAVGQACNKNPLALIIPCHRVVGADNIGGFAGGNSAKSRLLEIEKEVQS